MSFSSENTRTKFYTIPLSCLSQECEIINPILKNCGGCDVHKSMVMSCILTGDFNEQPRKEIRDFGTMTKEILTMANWFLDNEVYDVAMESTGVYWKPIFNILESKGIKVVLVNARHIKNLPGRKTDIKDAQWIAELFRTGLISPSFIPPKEIRELRDLNRTRRKLVEEKTRIKNRIEKVLQDSNIKLSSVVSNVFGVSGRALISSLSDQTQLTPDDISSMVKGQLKNKVNQIGDAMEGKFSETNKFLLKQHLRHLDFLEISIAEIDLKIEENMMAFQTESELIQSIPGISKIAASSIIAEIGADMSRFPNEHHLSSWAAMCPGNNESAGKKKSGKTRKGNNYLKGILTECAWAASRTKDTELSAFYHRLVRKKGKKRALVALGHKMLIEIFRVLKSGNGYVEKGPEVIAKDTIKREEYFIRKLENMGYSIQKLEIPA